MSHHVLCSVLEEFEKGPFCDWLVEGHVGIVHKDVSVFEANHLILIIICQY